MNYKYIYIIIIIVISTSVFSQEKDNKLDTQVINVIKAYSPKVSDAYKLKVVPKVEIEESKKNKLEYNTYATGVVSTFEPSKIGAKSLGKKEEEQAPYNYFLVGYGNYKTPLVNVFMSNKNTEEENYGFFLQHLSSSGEIKSTPLKSSFINTYIDGFYRQQLGDYYLKTNVLYKFQLVNWYGASENLIRDNDSISSLDVRQYFHTIEGGASITNNSDEDDFFKKSSIDAYRISDKFSSYENRVKADATFYIPLEDQQIKIEAQVDFLDNEFAQSYNKAEEAIKNKYLNIGLAPSLLLKKDNIDLSLGLNIMHSNDMSGNNNVFNVYPNISASMNLIDGLISSYAELKGGIHQNSYKEFAEDMPFISPTQTIAPTSVQYDFLVGMKGKLISNISYNTSFGYRKENGYIHYIKNNNQLDFSETNIKLISDAKAWELGNSFSAVRDTSNILEIKADVEYEVSNVLFIVANAQYNTYTSTKYKSVYNKPNVQLSGAVKYMINSNIRISAEVFFVGERSFVDYVEKTYTIDGKNITSWDLDTGGKLDSYLDMNLRATYDISKKLSTFLRVNNILNKSYELYKDYPVQGIQVMAGVNYKF